MPRFDHPLIRHTDLAALRDVRLCAGSFAEGAYTGSHRSRARGGAVEFAEHRPYVPGDDIRRLDWRILARTGRRYVRQYEAQRNLILYVLVDQSDSMNFQGHMPRPPAKWLFAARLATLLAFVAARDGEAVAVSSSADEQWPRPASGWAGFAATSHQFAQPRSARADGVVASLHRLAGSNATPGLLVLTSDFLDHVSDTAAWQNLDLLRARGFDVALVHVVHPEEEDLPAVAAAKFVDPERRASPARVRPAEVAKRYRQRFAAHLDQVRHAAVTRNCRWVLGRSIEEPAQVVRRLMEERCQPC